jgi:stage III sporulation protein AH
MLKKQTVWLLTMLSLLIVLSVYYILSPTENDLAINIDNGEDKEETVETDSSMDEGSDAEVTDITNVTSDELFATIRMELQDDRSMEKSRLESIVASGSASIEEKDVALQEIDEIETTEMRESILEQTIVSEAGYEDVLVRNSSGDKVHVQVLADELSDEEALRIMQMVRDEFERDITVEVNYQSAQASIDE